MSTKTLVLLKPDAVERGLVGSILSRFETKGLKIVAMELRTLNAAILERHYEEHKGKGFYPELVAFMSRCLSLIQQRQVRKGFNVLIAFHPLNDFRRNVSVLLVP